MNVTRRFRRHSGSMNWTLAVILGSLAVLALLGISLFRLKPQPKQLSQSGKADKPLVLYCAASNVGVLKAICADYEREFGVPIELQPGPSQTLLASITVTGTGDLYLPADDSYLVMAREKNLLEDQYPLASMNAVVAVAQGNPKKIASWADLQRPEVHLAQANPEAAAIAKMTKETLAKQSLWDVLHQKTTVYKTTVNEVANDVKAGSVDAGIVFDAVLHDYPTLEAVTLPELSEVRANVALGVLKASKQPQRARHFARYVSASDKGLVHYKEFGFQPVDGDPWAEVPEIMLYSGSMLRPAIEKTITEFEEREGAKVTRVYNGCGILVAQMKAGQVPDAYFACDKEFMNQVKDLFPASETVSQNELVILVKKGNPAGIRNLKDLSKEGLRVGIGHEKQCAMGWLTQRTFDEGGVKEQVMKNVVVQTPTGDMLVNQMRSGSLDAAVAYLSNAAGAVNELDAIRIQGIQCSVADQPYGIAKDSPHKQLAERLLLAIRTKESQERFKQEGFRWMEAGAKADE